jgi:hypothetical protein
VSGTPRARRFLVVGGGCFGAAYARSLLRARARRRLPGDEVWVIDRDPGCAAAALAPAAGLRLVTAAWEEFFAGYLRGWARAGGPREEDFLVPSPRAPQLFVGWLTQALGDEVRLAEIAPPLLPETPLARLSWPRPAGPRLALSFAEWPCPVRCIEPAVCPATRQPRTWEITQALRAYAQRLRAAGIAPLAGPYLGRVTHLVEGVGGFPLMDWARTARALRAEWARRSPPAPLCALVGTVSGCHGAVSLLRAESRDAAPAAGGVSDRG